MKLPMAVGRPLGAVDGRRRALRFRQRASLARGVVEQRPRGAVGDCALGHASGDGGVLERQPVVRIQPWGDDGVDRRQVDAGDLVAALDQHVAEMFLGDGIAELAGVDRGPDQVVGERQHPSRRPERVVITHLHIGRRWDLGPPLPGIESIALELADRRILDVIDRLPRAQRKTEREEALSRRISLIEVLVAEVPFVQVVVEAEGRADVLQIMLHDRAAVRRRQSVERVRRLPVREVRPRPKDAQRAELAAMLVRDEVVGIVGTSAGVQEIAEDLAGNQTAGDDPIGPVRVPRDPFEDLVDVVPRERRPRAGRTTQRRLRVEFDPLRIERRQVRFDLVVAKRPEDLASRSPRPTSPLPENTGDRTRGTTSRLWHPAR